MTNFVTLATDVCLILENLWKRIEYMVYCMRRRKDLHKVLFSGAGNEIYSDDNVMVVVQGLNGPLRIVVGKV